MTRSQFVKYAFLDNCSLLKTDSVYFVSMYGVDMFIMFVPWNSGLIVPVNACYIIIVFDCLCDMKWQPTPVFLPGESHGQSSLAGYSP